MNIEIANRLVNLRKSNNLSQEALAEKLGISRQAVSKWERAEASPDTDNLILLSRLYGISLDELLKTDDEIPGYGTDLKTDTIEAGFVDSEESGGLGSRNSGAEGSKEKVFENNQEEYVHVGFQGVHVRDKNGEVHVGWNGIHVDDKKKGDNVHIDKNGVYVNGERYDKEWFSHHRHFPVFMVILIIYLAIGCIWNLWHPGWLLFFLVPIWYSLIEAIERKDANCFAYPVLMVLLFLMLGMFKYAWHPGWVVFLTIPLYYSLVSYFRASRKQPGEESNGDSEEAFDKREEEKG